ncbi:hypothetical protein K488DRAFT_45724 [Vararia minispora EC-137]|uniref:Uncharacterized protein n=1 Tax=Vararia minispora EC-137 TaxID=1314806 RepID=A0ACB8QRQ3_9AGAM|nr:hypothetical protein K488DRAFT_45724 [Vararia minispora EC-137]
MNSTLQAFASLSALLPYLDELHAKAEQLDVPSPVTDVLRDLLKNLNEPQSYSRAIRPHSIIDVLSHPEPGKRSPLFSSREHQDAQELFQLVSELVKKEAAAVDTERMHERGLGAVLELTADEGEERLEVVKLAQRAVFDGLTANRRSCFECGYTEAVMHFSFDSWQLPLPRTTACRLEECLAEYTKLEVLTDCICRRCSMSATLTRLTEDVERLAADPTPSNSRKRTLREARKLKGRVEIALKEGRVEEEIKGLKVTRVFSRASTKQAMIARPPRVLALHLNRSLAYGAYASKNPARVAFTELLDLSPYTTGATLSTRPDAPISSPSPSNPTPPVLYRLVAVVCHYGTHQFGHYVAFRRKPPIKPPRVERVDETGEIRFVGEGSRVGRGWLRISDDNVSEVGVETALAEGSGAFMLYYERVLLPEDDATKTGCGRILRSTRAGRSGNGVGCASGSEGSETSSGESRGTSVTSVEELDAPRPTEDVKEASDALPSGREPRMVEAL